MFVFVAGFVMSYSAISVYVAVGGAIAIVAIVLTVFLTMVVVYCICKNKKKTTTSHNGSLTGSRTICMCIEARQ